MERLPFRYQVDRLFGPLFGRIWVVPVNQPYIPLNQCCQASGNYDKMPTNKAKKTPKHVDPLLGRHHPFFCSNYQFSGDMFVFTGAILLCNFHPKTTGLNSQLFIDPELTLANIWTYSTHKEFGENSPQISRQEFPANETSLPTTNVSRAVFFLANFISKCHSHASFLAPFVSASSTSSGVSFTFDGKQQREQ